jgi:hypothetical protein
MLQNTHVTPHSSRYCSSGGSSTYKRALVMSRSRFRWVCGVSLAQKHNAGLEGRMPNAHVLSIFERGACGCDTHNTAQLLLTSIDMLSALASAVCEELQRCAHGHHPGVCT